MDYYCTLTSLLGPLTLASDGEALIGLWFQGQKHFKACLGQAQQNEDVPVFAQARTWLARYFAAKNPGDIPPIRLRGTNFQKEVWSLLGEIPYGQVVTYGDLAKRLEHKTGRRTSPRAVGAVIGRNPLSLFLPCHRVVGSSGNLTGYAGGLDRKMTLLLMEGVDSSRLQVPAKDAAL